jgi:Fe-S-cluster containining protein
MSFPCTSCGACCRHIDRAESIINTKPEYSFPYKWDESGRCEMLGEDDKCKVYNDRPTLCNIDKLLDVSGMSKKKFYAINIKGCHDLMKEEGIYKKYRIKRYSI